MHHHHSEKISAETITAPLARAIERHVHSAGDHETALPALSLHRRHAPTEPVPCIYPLSLAVTTQGDKQVMVGDKIASVVAWIKQNFTKAIRVDDLAANANMSPSAFRQRFHDITGMSPLQYQKQLRLQEARQLMLNQKKDAGQAAILVGYQSASQFTASTAASSAHRLTAISRISVCTAGRPCRRFGYVRFRAISSRCQRSMVSCGAIVATSAKIGRP